MTVLLRMASLLTLIGLLLAGCGGAPAAQETATGAAVAELAAAAEATAAPAQATTAPAEVGEASPTQTEAAATDAAAGEKVKVTWWTGGGQEQQTMLQEEFVASFNAAHPNIELEMTFPEDANVMNTAVQAGEGPDILDFQGYGDVGEYIAANRLLPLDEYAQQYGWKAEFLPWAYDVGVVDGKLYSVPLTYESMGTIFYNKTVFDQNNWKPPTTRDELEQIATASAEAGIVPFSNGNAGNKFVNQFWLGVLYSNYAGADNVYQALTQQKKWDDPVFVESVSLFKEWVERGWIAGGVDNYFSYDWDNSHILLAEGKGAMLLEGTWGFNSEPTYFGDTQQEWDWFSLPPLRQGVETGFDLSVGQIIGINANSKNPDAAAEVLDWVYGDKERAVRITKGFGYGEWFVPLQFTAADFGSGVDERVLRYVDEFGKVGDKVGYTIWTFWPAKSQEYVSKELDRVLTGDLSAEEFSAGLQSVFAEEFAAGKAPTAPETGITSGD